MSDHVKQAKAAVLSPTAAAAEIDDGLAPQPAAQLTALLGRLPDLSNRDAIDRVAVEFTFLNSKAARKRLVKVRAPRSYGSRGTDGASCSISAPCLEVDRISSHIIRGWQLLWASICRISALD